MLSLERTPYFSPSTSSQIPDLWLPFPAPTTSSHSIGSSFSLSITPSLCHFRLKTYLFMISFPPKTLLASRLTPWTSWLDHFFCATGFLFLVLFITSFFWFYAAEIKLASHHLLGAIKYSLLHRTMQLKSKYSMCNCHRRFSSRTGEGRDLTRQPANSGSPGKPPLKQRFTCSLLPQTASGHTKHFAPVTLDNQGSKCLTKFQHEWWLFYAHHRVGERPHYALVTLTQRKKRLKLTATCTNSQCAFTVSSFRFKSVLLFCSIFTNKM